MPLSVVIDNFRKIATSVLTLTLMFNKQDSLAGQIIIQLYSDISQSCSFVIYEYLKVLLNNDCKAISV